MALTWTEKLALLTQKGLTWKEVQEMDKGLDSEKVEPKEPKEPKEPEPKEPKEPKEPEPKEPKEPEPDEKDLKIAELEAKLKEAQSDNVHANNGDTKELTFDEQLDTMFKDYKF